MNPAEESAASQYVCREKSGLIRLCHIKVATAHGNKMRFLKNVSQLVRIRKSPKTTAIVHRILYCQIQCQRRHKEHDQKQQFRDNATVKAQ